MRTHIFLVLDRSGSMSDRKNDHIGGLKSFIEQQKGIEPRPNFTFVQFDSNNPFDLIYDGVDIGEVSEITLEPRGMTPLLDAVGRTIAHAKEKVRVDEAPLFVVVTDGEENYSVEWDRKSLAHTIKDRESVGWKFVFLGAGIDAFSEAGKIGLANNTVANVANTSAGIANMYNVLRSKTTAYTSEVFTSGMVSMDSATLNFSDEERNSLSAS